MLIGDKKKVVHSVKEKIDPNLLQRLWNLRHLSFSLLVQKLSWIIRDTISNYFFDHFVAGQAFASLPKQKHVSSGISSSRPTSTLMLKKMFRLYSVQPHEVLVDIGCGRGRAIAWWLNLGYKNRIYGFELNHEIASLAKKGFAKCENVTIINENIFDMFPVDADVFYLANPFAEEMTKEFKARLIDTYYGKKNPTIIYYHCRHIGVFRNDPRFEIQGVNYPEWSLQYNFGFPWYAIIRMISPSSR